MAGCALQLSRITATRNEDFKTNLEESVDEQIIQSTCYDNADSTASLLG